MKIRGTYVLREVAGNHLVVPIGQAVADFNGVITFNETGALLWKTLESGADEQTLADAVLAEYDVDAQTALSDAREFVAELRDKGILEETPQ